MTSVGETTVAMPSQATDAIPLVVLPAEKTNAPEDLESISRHGEDSREQEHLLAVSGSALRASETPPHPYANRTFLSRYIAAVDPRIDTLRVKMAKRMTILKIQALLALTILVINITLTVWTITSYPPDYRGVGTLLLGNCSAIKTVNGVVHLALNIASSLFLGAGNYCMQTLVAPSRPEMNRAHFKGVSLDIGVANVKNLWYINRGRVITWVLIGTLATLLHLFWNSAVFASFAYVSYPRAMVTSDFSAVSDDWSISNLHAINHTCSGGAEFNNMYQNVSSIYSLQTAAKSFTRLERRACMEDFIDPLTATRALVVVALNVTSAQNNGSSLIYGGLSGCWDVWDRSNFWICAAYETGPRSRWCALDWASTFVDRWVGTYSYNSPFPTALIDYCLVGDPGDNSQRCAIHYSAYVLPIVCAFTCLESLLILWTCWKYRDNTMLTIGDAISDFLKDPDVAMVDLSSGNTIGATITPRPVTVTEARWVPTRTSWFKAISIRIWTISLILFTIGLAYAFILLGTAIFALEASDAITGPLGIWKLGFGVNAAELVTVDWGSSSEEFDLLKKLLAANAYQLFVSFLYVFYNNILTRQLVADEWTRFLRPEGKKPLRVSTPVGMQRSSYMLSLPMTYSVPLMISFILLHSLISQSIFLVQADTFGPGPENYRIPTYDKSDVGYSVLGIIFSICLGALLVAALLVNAVRRHYSDVPTEFPAMGTSSLAISAACQPPKGDDEAYLFELRLGIVKDEEYNAPQALGRLTFSTSIYIQEPKAGVVYRQPAMTSREPSMTIARKLWTPWAKCFDAGVGRFWKRTNPSVMSKTKAG